MNYENSYKILSDFIVNNKDWKEKLKPYMKSFNQVEFNDDWLVLMYCLFDIPKDPNLFELIKRCRGTVVNVKTGEVICAPFLKFWNLGEDYAADIDWTSAKVTHKRDGWIYKAFVYNGSAYFASNGMTVSQENPGAPVDKVPGKPELSRMADVLKRAWKFGCGEDLIFDEKDGHLTAPKDSWLYKFGENCTFCFELESPWNRLHTELVDDAKLWLIMARDSAGDEHDVWTDKKLAVCPFERPRVFDWKTEQEMTQALKSWTAKVNGEGVVVVDKNFNRVKIKIEDYRRLKFQSESSDYSDNRLFKYFINDEIDDLIAVNKTLLPRIEIMREKLTKLEKLFEDWEKKAKQLKDQYDRANFYQKAPKELHYFYSKSANELKESYINRWKTKTQGFTELCSLVDN